MSAIKQQCIFQEDEDLYFPHSNDTNRFTLTDQQRNNIHKRLPRGFALVKSSEIINTMQFIGNIQYVPQKRQIRVASEELSKQFFVQPIGGVIKRQMGKGQVGVDKTGLRFSQLPEGKSKQAEKIKNILQRFRKHYKYTQLSQHLQKIGFLNAFQQIQAQNRKNLHTIDSFKDRCIFVFTHTRNVTYQEATVNLINQMMEQFLFHVEQARKLQFQGSLGNVQKSIDKVTRELSEIKESGNYYYRKKKRNQKNYDEKQLLYISDLIRALPQKDLVGIFEIIEEKPFQEISNNLQFDLNQIRSKKVREIQFYVKKKLSNHYKSRERKRQKIDRKNGKPSKSQMNQIQEKNKLDSVKRQPQDSESKSDADNKAQNDDVNYIFEYEREANKDNPQPDRSLFGMGQGSRNDFDFMQQPDDQLFFGGINAAQPSVRNLLVPEQSEKQIVQEENVQFERPNLQIKTQGPYEDSSDSSMITDEQDSQY